MKTSGWATWLPLSILAAATVVLMTLSLFFPGMGVTEEDRCFREEAAKPDPVWAYYDRPNEAPENPGSAAPIQLSLVPDQSTTLHFGRSESVRSFDVDYQLSLQGTTGADDTRAVQTLAERLKKTPVQLDILQFRRADGAYLDTELVRARARVIGDRVRVTVCIDRRDAEKLGDPGSYHGTVSIIDPRVARVDLPLDLDAADPDWARALSLVGLALLAGSWVTWVVKEQKADTTRFEPHQWATWSVTAIGIISIVAGSVAAAAVFQASYLNNPVWGVSVSDPVALLTGSFVAFMGATTSIHVAALADKLRAKQVETTT
jgi:hypothetical protein